MSCRDVTGRIVTWRDRTRRGVSVCLVWCGLSVSCSLINCCAARRSESCVLVYFHCVGTWSSNKWPFKVATRNRQFDFFLILRKLFIIARRHPSPSTTWMDGWMDVGFECWSWPSIQRIVVVVISGGLLWKPTVAWTTDGTVNPGWWHASCAATANAPPTVIHRFCSDHLV